MLGKRYVRQFKLFAAKIGAAATCVAVAAALAAAQPLVQLARGAAPGRALCAASLFMLAYAANMEQVLVVYTGCLAGVLLWHAAARRRVHWAVWAQQIGRASCRERV